MAGIGYPSTWTDVLDAAGSKIPKRDKKGDIIKEKDGSIRYQQKPGKQGIVDWIENQKSWLEQQMLERYGWQREYKGSHPRGHLETPQYKAACAQEQLKAAEDRMEGLSRDCAERIDGLIEKLDQSVDSFFSGTTNLEMIRRYLELCPDAEFDEIQQKAFDFLDSLPCREQQAAKKSLQEIISNAQATKIFATATLSKASLASIRRSGGTNPVMLLGPHLCHPFLKLSN
ncbi:MAG: hypothetical protein Q4F17_01630 [Eubacteriales bacterium]|nr:hypothetical protein [Eubacteriales bacterium]